MYPVTSTYKTDFNKMMRNPSYIKVNLAIIEPDAIDNDSLSDNGHMFYSSSSTIDEDTKVTNRYATFEHNRLILDGNQILPPEVAGVVDYYQGFVGDVLSDLNGYYSTNPKVTVTFTIPLSLLGLTFRFDSLLNSYPSNFRIIAYNDTTEVFNQLVHPNNYDFIFDTPIPSTGTCNKFEFIFERSFTPYRRASLEYVMFGLNKQFTDSTITTATWSVDVDLLSSKLPTNKFEFTAIDVEKLYNPDNPNGVWKYIEKQQPAFWEYGYELDNGSIEWITGGNLYTDGNVKVSSEGSISMVSFSFTPYMNQLTDVFYKGSYNNPSKKTLATLAQEVFAFAGINSKYYWIDPELSNISTSLPLPEVSVAEALQLIANAGRCILYTARTGVITLKRIDLGATPEDFYFTFTNMKSIPKVDKIPMLYSIDTYFSKFSEEVTQSTLVTIDTINTGGVNTTIRITHDEAKSITLETTNVTIVSSTSYAKSTVVVFNSTATGSITVKGYKLNRNKTNILYLANGTGYNCPIENPLLDNYADAYSYAQWVAQILIMRNTYEAEDRGYPELDAGDIIKVDTLFSSAINAVVISSKIVYNGTLSGTTKFITMEG